MLKKYFCLIYGEGIYAQRQYTLNLSRGKNCNSFYWANLPHDIPRKQNLLETHLRK